MLTTLQTVSGIEARIFQLPGRPPFMVAADLAETYGTTVKAINQAVKRNPARFPEDFAFHLTEPEAAFVHEKWSQNVTTSQGNRTDLRPLVFTHAGAYALSAVLKTPVAAEVSVIVHRAFAAIERRAQEETQNLLLRLRVEAKLYRSTRARVVDLHQAGFGFDAIWRAGTMSRPKLADVVRDCVRLGLIPAEPAGTPAAMPDEPERANQPDLFARATTDGA